MDIKEKNIEFDENKIIANRRDKLSNLRKKKKNAYPNKFKRDFFAKDLHSKYEYFTKDELETLAVEVKIAGRLMLKRIMGKASFVTVQDMTGNIQLYINNKNIGDEIYEDFKHWDLGDIIYARGNLFKTNHGELSIKVTQIELLSKSLRPLPDKFKGLVDQEQKYRQRYVDLIINKDSKDIFIKRSKIIQTIRSFMIDEGYLEVETPMMHPIPGGASAKPFITHHNSLGMDLYLRVAPEIYLKKLIIGGLERVFEINRSFRNEGVSTRHNPEFTMIEFYEAFSDYNRMMDLSENIIRKCAIKVLGTLQIKYDGKDINLEDSFARLTISEAILKYNSNYTKDNLNNLDWLQNQIKELSGKTSDSIGSMQLELFELTTEFKIINPTFIINHPVETSPLARSFDDDTSYTERFELFIAGRELANGYSELNDPEDQAKRFKLQLKQKQTGNDEAMHYDDDYIKAMEYGLPPTGGCGIGVDRLVMLLTDSNSIKDVILFPLLRNE